MLRKYNAVKEKVAELLKVENYQDNTEEIRDLSNTEEPYQLETSIDDTNKNINVATDSDSDLTIKANMDQQISNIESRSANQAAIDNIKFDSTTIENLKQNRVVKSDGTVKNIKSNLADNLKRMITFPFLNLPSKFYKSFAPLFNRNLEVD
jgi:membrane-associated HD superfamily phosphohydrolase